VMVDEADSFMHNHETSSHNKRQQSAILSLSLFRFPRSCLRRGFGSLTRDFETPLRREVLRPSSTAYPAESCEYFLLSLCQTQTFHVINILP
jgi:hypothetical protein